MTSRSTVPISLCFVCLIMSHFRQESPLDEEFDEIMRESDISQTVSEAKVMAGTNFSNTSQRCWKSTDL